MKEEGQFIVIKHKKILEARSNGINKVACGVLKYIARHNDIRKIKKGNIVFVRRSAFRQDSLLLVYECVQKDASGIILEDIGFLDHGVIASKELNIPTLIVTNRPTNLHQGDIYTLIDNKLYSGKVVTFQSTFTNQSGGLKTETKIKLNLGFPTAIKKNQEIVEISDGIAFCRLEFSLLEILNGFHPLEFIKRYSSEKLAAKLAKALEPLVKAFSRKPVWIRTDDFTASLLKEMTCGNKYEKDKFNNFTGWRGIRRSIEQPELVIPQFRAIKILAEKGYRNIGLFPPMTNEIYEYRKWLLIAHQCSLTKNDVKFGLMVETPSCALTIKDFVKDISFVVFGTNDLTQFTLAVDRADLRLSNFFDEKKQAVLLLMKQVIKTCRKYGIETSIGGQAGSDTSLVRFLLGYGLSGTSVNPDINTIINMRKFVYNYEKSKN